MPTLACSMRTPAISGPTRVPRLSTVEVAAFEATSSSGVRVRDGKQRLERGPDEGGRDPDECGAHIDAALCSRERGDGRSREGDRAEKHRAE
jgi:hypothetical protein